MRPNNPPAITKGDIAPDGELPSTAATPAAAMVKSITCPDAYGKSNVMDDVTPNVAADRAINFHSCRDNSMSRINECAVNRTLGSSLFFLVSLEPDLLPRLDSGKR